MMKIKKGFKKDPVCEMLVPETENALVFLQVNFAFCSEQCKQRFQEQPYLYIGHNGKKSVKQKGIEVIKDRRIKLDKPVTNDETEKVFEALNGMMGILDVSIEGNQISLRYDLLQATQEQIETELTTLGLKLGSNWQERIRRSFIQISEDSECSAMSSQSHHSCH